MHKSNYTCKLLHYSYCLWENILNNIRKNVLCLSSFFILSKNDLNRNIKLLVRISIEYHAVWTPWFSMYFCGNINDTRTHNNHFLRFGKAGNSVCHHADMMVKLTTKNSKKIDNMHMEKFLWYGNLISSSIRKQLTPVDWQVIYYYLVNGKKCCSLFAEHVFP